MRLKLGEILVEQGAVRPEDVDAALEHQSSGDPSRLGDLLVANGKLTAVQLARGLSLQSGLPFVQLEQVSPQVAALVPMT
ncbi:MAG: general secretion pathway protein GspE, partial [Myxococcaceae bacterium]|nr:general secretion pathway protein GspE [Myxococcaceae bacterium]